MKLGLGVNKKNILLKEDLNWCREEIAIPNHWEDQWYCRKIKLPGEYGFSATFNVSDLFCLM